MEVTITNYEKVEEEDTDLKVEDTFLPDHIRLVLSGKAARVKASELKRAIDAVG